MSVIVNWAIVYHRSLACIGQGMDVLDHLNNLSC